MKRRLPLIVTLLAILAYGVVTWLRAPGSHATAQAADELAELRQKDIPALVREEIAPPELVDILSGVTAHYADTRDVHYTAPGSGIGILHIACIFKKAELVRCLLLDGAAPNRHGAGDDSPLLLAVGTYLTPGVSTQAITTLVDTLLEGGAKFAESGHSAGDFLTEAAYACEDEQVMLHLMDKGAAPDARTATPLAMHGWDKALARVLETEPNTQGLLHALALGSASFEGNYAACFQLLLERGADLHASEEAGQVGETPLFLLAQVLSEMPAAAQHYAQALDVAAELLRHGADPNRRAETCETHPGFCPYDLLALRPGLLKELTTRGIQLTAPPLRFSAGVSLPADVCRAAALPPAVEELAPHFCAIAELLKPSPDMQQQEIYPQALESAVALLVRIDPEKANEQLAASPLWQLPPAAETTPPLYNALLSALREHEALRLPKSFICRTAEAWAAAGQADAAAGLLEYLKRCPDAQAEIERYCTDELLPLQAGAYAALLSIKGLPDARDKGVEEWLHKHGRKADTDFLREAQLLTSLERLWAGRMTLQEQRLLLDLMRRIGAPSAAAAYEQIALHLDDPEALDILLQRGDEWKYELEAATARLFLEHATEFTPSSL